jgi:hypothetical protein
VVPPIAGGLITWHCFTLWFRCRLVRNAERAQPGLAFPSHLQAAEQ